MEKFFIKTYPNTFESAAITNWSSEREDIFNKRLAAITSLEVGLFCAFFLPSFPSPSCDE